MKKITFLFALLLLTATLHAQNFPYKRPELLLGKQVKVIPTRESEKENYYSDFSSDKHETYMPVSKHSSNSKAEALKGRIFTVKAIHPGRPSTSKTVWLELEDADKSVLYYSYRESMLENYYPFEVAGGIEYPDDFYCDYIETSESIYAVTHQAMPGIGTLIMKRTEGTKTYYSLMLTKFIASDGKYGDGLTLLLENDKKISRPQQTILPMYHDAKYYKYQQTFDLTPQEAELLTKHKIKAVKFIDKVEPVEESEKIQQILKCLIAK